ncbi:cupredoxin domain-containing protein [Paenibacillus sp. p3-SID1389]|uniref:cupredoxin domain-containing protein n=1 Tax=Paenibacillus sp. p3-SID1389 TaxID=2916364 RepID=UPI0021A2B9FF|nr:cupredoxin domain-containing protein [Paenibacillus sp. p3-SID1389]MCT2195467.1 cupredoxin domain-containing protein [Paenibacillus sp. p3-SID1389]
MITIRPLQPHEFDFFTDMHYESIHIPQGKPPKDELLNAPHLKKYHEGWGRKGDRAFVAVKDDQLAGRYGIDCSTKRIQGMATSITRRGTRDRYTSGFSRDGNREDFNE